MNKQITITNHKSLKRYILTLKSDLDAKKLALAKDSKIVLSTLPSKFFQPNFNLEKSLINSRHLQNPIGKLMSSVIKKTLLKKSNFLFRFIGGVLAKRSGKKIEQKLRSRN